MYARAYIHAPLWRYIIIGSSETLSLSPTQPDNAISLSVNVKTKLKL